MQINPPMNFLPGLDNALCRGIVHLFVHACYSYVLPKKGLGKTVHLSKWRPLHASGRKMPELSACCLCVIVVVDIVQCRSPRWNLIWNMVASNLLLDITSAKGGPRHFANLFDGHARLANQCVNSKNASYNSWVSHWSTKKIKKRHQK